MAILVVAAFIIAVAVGIAWFIAVPVAVALLMLPLAYFIALFTKPRGGSGGSERSPSTGDASYQPIADPEHPGTMRR